MTTLSSQGKQDLDNYINELLAAKRLPGFILGVSNTEEEIYFHGGGLRIVNDDASGQVNPDSVFWVCSETKLVTYIAALKLIEQGKLSKDTLVADYLPQLSNPVILDDVQNPKNFKPATTPIAVKHLLNHSSGLFYPLPPDGSLNDGYTNKEMHAAEDPYAAWFKTIQGDLPGVPLKFEPGTDFAYGLSADVLGFVIEKVTGQSLEQVFQENIFKPLGMTSSSFYLTPNLRERLVNLTWREKDGTLVPFAGQVRIIEQDPAKVKLHLGGVGLYSTERDWLKLLRHILQIKTGKAVSNPILKKETVEEIWVPSLPETGEKTMSAFTDLPNWGPNTQFGTAMGLITKDWPNRRKKGTGFWSGWAGLEFFVDPGSGIALAFGIQILPWGDQELWKAWPKLESLVYSALAV
ncbi:hypothetical protein CVT26_006379 [Gymnopilus dilepis]|uniref:Beta-lactamase-related domain-containing protein n=1 Tax=Gymnopilus dilepis TaxID=231916 RepID=A0A409WBN0_9AGAR|nr:hypothetical protein CVT26_006379 [Gymnopilus dilepis]